MQPQSDPHTRYEALTNNHDAALQVALNPANPPFIADHARAIAADALAQRDDLTVEQAGEGYWEHQARQLLKPV